MIVIVLILLGLCAWCYYRWLRTQGLLAQVNQVVENLVAGDIRIESSSFRQLPPPKLL
jgi:hypothetical protein